jgi:O-methyltransferase involved in polyketide biosynthesis
VVPYLTLDAFRSTVKTIAQLPMGSAVCFDYALAPHLLDLRRRIAFEALAARVAAAGEPFKLLFEPEKLEGELRGAGFARVEQTDSQALNRLYFDQRRDGLKLPSAGLGQMVTAWV